MSSTSNTTSTSNTAQGTSNAGATAGNAVKEGWNKIHGVGEAIRGNINTFADNATNTDDTRSKAVIDRGINEMRTGQNQGAHVAGVTPKDTPAEIQRRQDQTGNIGVNGETRFTK